MRTHIHCKNTSNKQKQQQNMHRVIAYVKVKIRETNYVTLTSTEKNLDDKETCKGYYWGGRGSWTMN